MVKSEVIKALAQREQIKTEDAQRIVGTLLIIFEEGLKQDGIVSLSGFGRLAVRVRQSRLGFSFQKHKPSITNQTMGVHFKVSRKLADRLLKDYEENQGEM